jgi:hypothetical protein
MTEWSCTFCVSVLISTFERTVVLTTGGGTTGDGTVVVRMVAIHVVTIYPPIRS